MRLSRVLATVLGVVAVSWQPAAFAGSIKLNIRVEPDVAARGLHLVQAEFPSPQVVHCRGKKILTLDATNASATSWGESRWSHTLDVTPKPTESLILCRTEGERLTPLWSGPLQDKAGKRLIGLDCWVRESLELECTASYAQAK